MNTFTNRLTNGEILIADGATGTNLHKMGLPSGVSPEELVIDNPGVLMALESAFVAAGSDIILTCTFGGTSVRMKDSRYSDRTIEINQRAVALAREAAAQREGVLVAGSVGPTGLLMQPFGPATPEEIKATYTTQIEALLNGGVDLLVIETMFSMEEATSAFSVTKALTELPVVVSFSYDRGTRTMMGVKPAQVVEFFADGGATVVGANCGTTLENMEKIIQEYAVTRPGFPLWAKPNAGSPRVEGHNQAIYDITPEQMGEAALKNIGLGARIVGGCCGSTPEHVAGIARAVKRLPS